MKHTVSTLLIILCALFAAVCVGAPASSVCADNDESYEYAESDSALNYCLDVAKLIAENAGETGCSRLLVGTYSECDFSGFAGITDIIYDGADRYVLQFKDSDCAASALHIIKDNADVRYVEEDAPIFPEAGAEATDGTASGKPQNGHYSWGVKTLGIDKCEKYLTKLKAGKVIVAVLDTGCAGEHELFSGRLVDGYNIVGDNYYTEDTGGHGTHVAGIIADCTSMVSSIKIMPVSVMYSSGFGYASLAAAGVDYAVARRADVINMSFSYAHESSYLDESVSNAVSKGCICVVAAGNQGDDASLRCPAHIKEIITVGAVNADLTIGSYSNQGSVVDVVAPGTSIRSAGLNGAYTVKSGTSAAAPHISACMALLKSVYPKLSASQLEKKLKSFCSDLGAEGRDYVFGYGIPDMSRLIADNNKSGEKLSLIPKGSYIRRISSSRRSVKLYWKKQSARLRGKRISGYQIQTARNSRFTKARKTNTVKGFKVTSTKVGKLKRRTKYYCRVRTFIKISGKSYYSKWSAVRAVKTG